MFIVSALGDTLEALELTDTAAENTVRLAPARGGMVTRFALRGWNVLYLDEATLRDPTKNVRGGNPILFPTPGKLEGDRYQRAGKSGSLPQHGFARNLPWRVVAQSTEDAACAVLELDSNAATRAVWDWDFRLEFRYALRGSTLRIEQTVFNLAPEPMPCGLGFHPYFHVDQGHKAETRVHTPATRAFDAVRREVLPVNIDLCAPELDLRLMDHGSAPCRLESPVMAVELRASPEFRHWVLWTLSGKDFICVEPWTCAADAMNLGDGLLEVSPGGSRTLWLEIEASPR